MAVAAAVVATVVVPAIVISRPLLARPVIALVVRDRLLGARPATGPDPTSGRNECRGDDGGKNEWTHGEPPF
jgi:hypothetical protein